MPKSSGNLFSVAGKTALGTGGGSGIGGFMATALSDAGATIILVGRDRNKLNEAFDHSVWAEETIIDLDAVEKKNK